MQILLISCMRAASGSLALGLIMGAPFVAMGVMINVGMGLANRMMPSFLFSLLLHQF